MGVPICIPSNSLYILAIHKCVPLIVTTVYIIRHTIHLQRVRDGVTTIVIRTLINKQIDGVILIFVGLRVGDLTFDLDHNNYNH